MIKQPMLFCNAQWQWSDIHNWPMLVSPKYDGVFVMKSDGHVLTRDLKPVPNKALREYLTKYLPEGVHGEFHSFDPGAKFHDINGFFHTHDAKLTDFNWCVRGFDIYTPSHYLAPYEQRYADCARAMFFAGAGELVTVSSYTCQYQSAVEAAFNEYVDQGHEGAVLRYAKARYKQGRATLRECIALKMFHWASVVGEIVGFTSNTGVTKSDQVGAIIVKTSEFGTLEVGSGFSHTESRAMKADPQSFIGQKVYIKYKPHGMKDKPRHPILECFVNSQKT